MMIDINLTRQIKDKEVIKNIANVFYGIIPTDGKTRKLTEILENQEIYRKRAQDASRRLKMGT